MNRYTVITENDSSKWDDETGIKYHFPPRYIKYLIPGTKVLYYKGRLLNKKFADLRLSQQPHYFGIGEISKVEREKDSNNYYASIINFSLFKKAVPFKFNNAPIEIIPDSRKNNYWRDGVRPITKEVYKTVLELAELEYFEQIINDQREDDLTSVFKEGDKKVIYTTVYERNKKLRDAAIRLHGYSCTCCGLNFKEVYGEWGEGYIHVHHKKPISDFKREVYVDPQTDLVVVCANCHSMIHRKKNMLLSVEEIRVLIKKNYSK